MGADMHSTNRALNRRLGKLPVLLAGAALFGSTMVVAADSPPGTSRSGVLLANMDHSVPPQEDFFDYANGTWLRTIPIPTDRSSYGVQQLMIEQAMMRQRGI